MDRLVSAIQSRGYLLVNRHGLMLKIERKSNPPDYLTQLSWRMTKAGVIGDAKQLRDQWSKWPAIQPVTDPAGSQDALARLESTAKPATMLQLAEALSSCEGILLAATDADGLVRLVSRIARKLLDWYPGGQMVAWGRSFQHIMEARPGHLLAAISALGWGGVQRGLKAQSGGLWFVGEDISTSQPAGLYLNLVNGSHVPGVTISTLPIIFIFEFGEYLEDERPLDFLSVRYIHSVSDVYYLAPGLPHSQVAPRPGLLEQDALREWFITRFTGLADHLIRLENFRTIRGELRPLVMQQTSMTVNRILNVTAHLLASQEKGARYADFWDLVDLYGTLAGGISKMFSETYWQKKVVPAMATLPGSLAKLFADYANALHSEWVAETVAGVTDPTRRTGRTVLVGPVASGKRIPHDAFFSNYIDVRRNTLHGYDLRREDQRQFLAIHDGRLPLRLPEWGRIQFLALLTEPKRFIERRFLSS